MAAIATAEHPILPLGPVSQILEGTLLALGSDGGGNYSLMEVGTLDNQIKPCTDVLVYTGVAPIGFIQEHSDTLAVAGDQVTVFTAGLVWAVAGAAITKGMPVMSEGATQTGRVIAVTDGHWSIGIAWAAAAAEDDMFPVLIDKQIYTSPEST